MGYKSANNKLLARIREEAVSCLGIDFPKYLTLNQAATLIEKFGEKGTHPIGRAAKKKDNFGDNAPKFNKKTISRENSPAIPEWIAEALKDKNPPMFDGRKIMLGNKARVMLKIMKILACTSEKRQITNRLLAEAIYGDKIPFDRAMNRLWVILSLLKRELDENELILIRTNIKKEVRVKGNQEKSYYLKKKNNGEEKVIFASQATPVMGEKFPKPKTSAANDVQKKSQELGLNKTSIKPSADDRLIITMEVRADKGEELEGQDKELKLTDFETCALADMLNAKYCKDVLAEFDIFLGSKFLEIQQICNSFYYRGIRPNNFDREGDVVPSLFKKLISFGNHDDRANCIEGCSEDVQFLISLIDKLDKEKFNLMLGKLRIGFEKNIKHATGKVSHVTDKGRVVPLEK